MRDYNGYTSLDNLWEALGDEALGHAKYTLFGKIADEAGYGEIADSFYQTAQDELGHAQLWMKELGLLGDTAENLESAIVDEVDDSKVKYPKFANDAHHEGFDDLADKFNMTANVESRHAEAYRDYSEALKNGTLYKSNVPETWRCMNCGFEYVNEEAYERCPLCGYSKKYTVKS